jgi:hypothetical protein
VNDAKVIRIEIEYDDGMIEGAEGDIASEIWRAIQGSLTLQHMHGMTYQEPKFTILRKAGKESVSE